MLVVGSMNYWQLHLDTCTLATLIMLKSKASKLFGVNWRASAAAAGQSIYVKGAGVAIVKVAS